MSSALNNFEKLEVLIWGGYLVARKINLEMQAKALELSAISQYFPATVSVGLRQNKHFK